MKKLEVIFNAFLNNQIVCTDTRSIAAGCIYFALKGERFNGNEFAAKALELGASVVVVDEEVEALQNDSRVIVVEESLRALQDLAKLYRKTFQFPVLAITGSNGKTTTKELIREVLSKKFKVYATEGNLNNHIGVPLSLLRVPKNCEFAIIEMGANHQREIASYCEIALPDYGLITNIGKAHLEGFGGVPGIIKGKGELFDSLRERGKMAFVNIELPHLESMIKGMNYTAYGFEQDGMQIQLMKESPTISFRFKTGNSLVWQECETNLAGTYNLYNVASAIAVGRYFEVEMNLISDAITSYAPNNNRSQLWKSGNNEVILDAYNANPSSMEAALMNLASFENAYFILGDMFELGEYSSEEHFKIIQLSERLELEGVFVGEQFASHPCKSFKNVEDLHRELSLHPIRGKTILLKGSRGMQLEQLKGLL